MATFAERYGAWAVVAGASEGLGEALARGCASRGLNVVLIARRVELAQQLADDIAATTGVQTRALQADLADRDDLDRILADLAGIDVGLLIYNAAFSVVGPFWNFDIETHLKEIDVNVRGPLVLSHGFGERFRARGRGGIILMSSMGALQGMVRVANYSATKAYNMVLAEGLWAELRDDGVDVLVSCAGATRTPNYVASEPEDANVPVQEPEQVATETLNALGKKPTLFPARVLRFTHFLAFAALTVRFLPREWPGLKSPWLRPLILCGQHSLEIFCLGVFLAFAGHFILAEVSGGAAMHALISLAGILIMWGVAWVISWYKRVADQSGANTKNSVGNADLAGGG